MITSGVRLLLMAFFSSKLFPLIDALLHLDVLKFVSDKTVYMNTSNICWISEGMNSEIATIRFGLQNIMVYRTYTKYKFPQTFQVI